MTGSEPSATSPTGPGAVTGPAAPVTPASSAAAPAEGDGPGDGKKLEKALTLAGTLAGLAAYLYLLGGAVTWLHLATARLPGDAGLSAVDSRRLLLTGCRVALFELLLVAAVSAVVAVLVAAATLRRRRVPGRPVEEVDDLREGWNDLWTLAGMIWPGLAVLAVVVGLSLRSEPARIALVALGSVFGLLVAVVVLLQEPPKDEPNWNPRWRRRFTRVGDWIRKEHRRLVAVQVAALLVLIVDVGVGLAAVPALQGAILLAATLMLYVGPFLKWPRSSSFRLFRRQLLTSSGVWLAILAATGVALAWVSTPPASFPRTTVLSAEGMTLEGGYIAREGEGLYLASCRQRTESPGESIGPHIDFVPLEAESQLRLDGGQYRFDPGGRPSLLQALVAGVDQSSAAHETAPLDHPLRGGVAEVCGKAATP